MCSTSSLCRQTIFGALFYLMMILMIIVSGVYEIFKKKLCLKQPTLEYDKNCVS